VRAWVRMRLLGPNLVSELLLQRHDGPFESRWHDRRRAGGLTLQR